MYCIQREESIHPRSGKYISRRHRHRSSCRRCRQRRRRKNVLRRMKIENIAELASASDFQIQTITEIQFSVHRRCHSNVIIKLKKRKIVFEFN